MKLVSFIGGCFLSAFICTTALAMPSKKYSVTGNSNGEEYFRETACAIAVLDAQQQATEICFSKGYAGWDMASYGECQDRLISTKRKIKMTFYCVK